MRKSVLVALVAAIATGGGAASAQTIYQGPGAYTTYGNTTYGPKGSSQTTYGNTTYTQPPAGKPANQPAPTYSTYGNTTYGSNGTSYSTYGNTTYGSNGTTSTTYGNTTYMRGPDGKTKSCTVYGATTYCN